MTVDDHGEGAALGKPLRTPAAWTAADALAHPDEWQYEFNENDVEEVLEATKEAIATGKPVPVCQRAPAPTS
jgi:hypothetical protein